MFFSSVALNGEFWDGELKNALSFMQAAGNNERRRGGYDAAVKQRPRKAGGVLRYMVRLIINKRVSSQVCSFSTHKSSQDLGKQLHRERGGGAFLLNFSAFGLVLPTTSGRSALLFCPLPSPGYRSPSLPLEFPIRLAIRAFC